MENAMYEITSELNKGHGIFLVKEKATGNIYVQKTLDVYNKSVFEKLKEYPVAGIPRIHDMYESDNGLIIIEEYIDGQNLSEYLNSSNAIDTSQIITIALSVCDILATLHSFTPPVIHRDIKPSNIMISTSDEIYLIDLDAAKIVIEGQTQDTQLIGTQGYAAPEQYGFGASTVQTDIYGLGKLMQTMLTGSPDIPISTNDKLSRIINRCIQISPKDRFQSVQDLKTALMQLSDSSKHNIRKNSLICLASICVIILCIGCFSLFRKEKSSVTPTGIYTEDANTNTISTSSTSEPKAASPIGVYSGDYDEKLILAENGLAYYYCDTLTYSEPECKWYEDGDKIYIELQKLRCTIYAQVNSNDYAKLVFKSASPNWNTEKFKRISSDTESYILSTPPSASSAITVQPNGDMEFTIGNLMFTAPVQFLDFGDEFQKHYQIILIDNDTYSGYLGSCLFLNDVADYRNAAAVLSDDTNAAGLLAQYLDDVSLGTATQTTIADEEAYSYEVSGIFNEGFDGLKGLYVEGTLYQITNTDTPEIISILMIQTPGMEIDDTELFEEIIQSATKI